VLRTERLVLRGWQPSDRAAFARLNADRRVMEFFPSVLSREESEAAADRVERHFTEHGFGLWAVELPDVAPFIGFVGLHVPRFSAHFTPCVEIGWRLDPAHWGCGYATEGARAALAHGFELLKLDEIVAMTVPANRRSRAVMERLGMVRDPADDFDHPLVSGALQRHVLYRIGRP
jgi:RimJ/RimL family protein N-acetyltransferase